MLLLPRQGQAMEAYTRDINAATPTAGTSGRLRQQPLQATAALTLVSSANLSEHTQTSEKICALTRYTP